MSPAPRLPRLDRLLVARREPRLVDRLPAADDNDRPEIPDGCEPGPGGPDRADGPDGPDGRVAAGTAAAGTGAAAMPQMLQYPSSIVPAHPGVRAQGVTGTPGAVPGG
jgi:hypothetical protein